MSDGDSKLIAATASRATAKVVLWATGIAFVVMGSGIVAAGKVIFDGVILKIDSSVVQLDKDRNVDIANLNYRFNDLSVRLSDLSSDMRNMKDEQMRRTERIALLEAENKAFAKAMGDISPKLNRISEDVVAIKTQLGLRRSDRDRPNENPAPPQGLGRIPMLWNF